MLYRVLVLQHKIIKSSHNNKIQNIIQNKFKISPGTWNDKFELNDGSYSAFAIQDSFEYILKKHNEKTDNPLIRIYLNKIENRLHLKLKLDVILSI